MPDETDDATKVGTALERLAEGTGLTPGQMARALADWINRQGPSVREMLRNAAIDQWRAMNPEGGGK